MWTPGNCFDLTAPQLRCCGDSYTRHVTVVVVVVVVIKVQVMVTSGGDCETVAVGLIKKSLTFILQIGFNQKE